MKFIKILQTAARTEEHTYRPQNKNAKKIGSSFGPQDKITCRCSGMFFTCGYPKDYVTYKL